MAITSKNVSAFGLDISDSSIKLMWLQKKGKKIRPKAFNSINLPRGTIIKDVIKNPEQLASIIDEGMAQAKLQPIKDPFVVASLPESRAFIRVFDLPPMKKGEVAKAVKWEAEQHIPLSIDQVELDWQIINDQTTTQNKSKPSLFGKKKKEEKDRAYKIFLTAAPKETITPIVKTLKLAKLQPIILEIESLSTIRSCLGEQHKDKTILVADLGTNRTGLSIVKNGLIQFTSSLSMAGVDISKNISEKLNISFEEAERYKVKYGLNREKQKPEILATIQEDLQKLTSDLKNTIQYYQDHSTKDIENQIDEILIVGGSARLIGLSSYLSRALDIKVKMANPWINIYGPNDNELPPIPKAESLSYTMVIGLAQRGLDISL